MADQVFTHARDRHGQPFELAASHGRITALGPAVPRLPAAEIIDLGGQLVLPGFVDGHIHLDKSFVGDRWHPHQPASSLRERLAIEKRELAAAPPIGQRADALVAQAVGFGTVAMRCHVDVDGSTGLAHLHALREVRERWLGIVQIQLVAFPQAGVMSCPGSAAALEAAMREGADVIGGIDPQTFDGDSDGQLEFVFRLAERHASRIDIHLHEPGETGIAQLGRIAARTRALGLGGRVAVSHAYALGEVDAATLGRSADMLADAGVAIMTNAPGDHAFPPVRALRAAGVEVFLGNDNIRDAWWPYGNGDMLQRAMLLGYRSAFHGDDDLQAALDMATSAGARVLGLEDHGLAPGNAASFVVVDAPNAAAAVAAPPAMRRLVRRGELLPGT